MSDEEYRAFAHGALIEHVKAEEIDPAELERFVARLSYVSVDAKSGEGFADLKTALGDSERIRIFYLAVAPSLFGDIAEKVASTAW